MDEIVKELYRVLHDKYNKSALSKKELALEIGCEVSTIDYYLSKGINLPNYKKLSGKGNGGKVLFPLHEVAQFLVQTNKVL